MSIVRVDELSPAATGPGATGRRVTLAEAKMLLPFRPLLPDLGPPSGIYVDRNQGLLTAVYGDGDVRLRLTELIAGTASFQKIVSSAPRVERVRVNGRPGYWIAGEHVVSGLFGEPELSGSALIWRQLRLTVRREGRLTKAQALQVARSVKRA